MKFGGTDTWEFHYQEERDRMFELAMPVLVSRRANGGEEEEPQDQEESLTPASIERARQVKMV